MYKMTWFMREFQLKKTPIRMDLYRNEFRKSESFGQKMTNKILQPEMFIFFDEVGGSTTQKFDGNLNV